MPCSALLFAEPGGAALQAWIDTCPNALYAALTYQGGPAWRERLMANLGDQGAVTALLNRQGDADLAALMENLGGYCLPSLCVAFDAVTDDQPTVFLAYTTKGWGTPLAGHKDNHSGLMTPAQMEGFRVGMAGGWTHPRCKPSLPKCRSLPKVFGAIPPPRCPRRAW